MIEYTIITPVYNREDCIARCIESVIKQLRGSENIEHIIVDDGSTDKTGQIAQRYSIRYPHIKFIAFQQNKGTNAARNAAIQAARGRFCILLDSDDYFHDDALKTICEITKNNEYKHYLFAPDDMVGKYALNPKLNTGQCVLHFKDFLTGNVAGDFIHVVNSRIMKKYPFDEDLRIYEGVFFLRFYKEAKDILFTNKIISIRDRNRPDSITRTTVRTNKEIIKKTLTASHIKLEWFYNDFIALGAEQELTDIFTSQLDNYLLLSDYANARRVIDKLHEFHTDISIRHKLTYYLRLGPLYRIVLKLYLISKYNILKKKLQ